MTEHRKVAEAYAIDTLKRWPELELAFGAVRSELVKDILVDCFLAGYLDALGKSAEAGIKNYLGGNRDV
jgi:hypothetical protein